MAALGARRADQARARPCCPEQQNRWAPQQQLARNPMYEGINESDEAASGRRARARVSVACSPAAQQRPAAPALGPPTRGAGQGPLISPPQAIQIRPSLPRPDAGPSTKGGRRRPSFPFSSRNSAGFQLIPFHPLEHEARCPDGGGVCAVGEHRSGGLLALVSFARPVWEPASSLPEGGPGGCGPEGSYAGAEKM